MPQALEQKVLQQALKLGTVVFSRSQINVSHGFTIARLNDTYQFLLPVTYIEHNYVYVYVCFVFAI